MKSLKKYLMLIGGLGVFIPSCTTLYNHSHSYVKSDGQTVEIVDWSFPFRNKIYTYKKTGGAKLFIHKSFKTDGVALYDVIQMEE